ncbi:S-4TM family putative pore-forming effector [uncultured Draconibacterium sp.]|uniref:ISAon1 family transposase n=1 Tax=uncultured Draconibacterium sp. TaxID=1573823 RepID=UPI003261BF11
MNNIQTNQNKADFIRLLKAQRVAYSIAKRCMSVEVIILLISIIFPILLIFFPDLVEQSLVIILSGGLVILSVLLNNLMKNRTNVAAKIQEEFDTKLFNLTWNSLLCGSNAIDQETNAKENAKWDKKIYTPFRFDNGDTKKQLLARSRYLLFKSADKWSQSQKQRAKILFAQYPDIKKAFDLTHDLRIIFAKTKDKAVAYTKLAHWYNKVTDSGFRSFNTISATIYTHYKEILNFFDQRSTNASAESFNAKLKAFRAALRGVSDIKYFLFRVAKIYA